MSITLFEHNVQLYSDFEALIKEKHKAMVVSATGTGKTSIALKYLEDHDFHGLVVCPQKSICRQWESQSTRIDAMTYQKFMKQPDINSYDCFIFDEAHHTGAEKWSIPIKELMSSTTKPVIGLTADPKRYLDNARDMGEELWDGNVVYGVDLDEAIQKRILPGGSYICALFDSGSELKKYINTPITSTLRNRLEMSLKNCQTITQILHKHMPPGNRKGIVFVDSIKSIPEGVELIKNAYPSESIMCIHSEQADNENARILDVFKSIEHGFIVTVNMLNEGIHMSEINTIIMLRRTLSPNLFMQQLGRGFTPNSTNVVIYDFVANSRNLNAISKRTKRISSMTTSNMDRDEKQHQLSQLIVYDYASPILLTLKDIKSFLMGRWTPEEDEILRKHYPIEGIKVANRISGRTPRACEARVQLLGLHVENNDWTREEDEILQKYYPIEGRKVCKRIVGRTSGACHARADYLGIYVESNRRWTPEEDEILYKYYSTEGSNVANRLPGRNKQACSTRACVLNIRTKIPDWIQKEDDIIREYYPTEGVKVAARLPERSERACNRRAKKLGISWELNGKWTPEEDEIMRKYYSIEGYKILNRLPGRSPGACSARAKLLGVEPRINKWTPEEDEILRKYYPTEGRNAANRLPERSQDACITRANKLGIETKTNRWTPEEDEILHKYYSAEGGKVANRLPGRSKKSCNLRAKTLGLSNPAC